MCVASCCGFFFFKQKTAYEMRISDWSSDVCSSDLAPAVVADAASPATYDAQSGIAAAPVSAPAVTDADARALFAANSETQASTFSEESAPTDRKSVV